MDKQKLDQHLNAVLRAAGSALRHYSLPKSLDDMRAAMKAAIDDATSDLQARVAELEADRAAQKPVAQIDDDECFQGPCRHATAFVPMPRGTPLYADPPVAAPVRLTDLRVVDLFHAWNDTKGLSHADLIRSVETAVLCANGFKVGS